MAKDTSVHTLDIVLDETNGLAAQIVGLLDPESETGNAMTYLTEKQTALETIINNNSKQLYHDIVGEFSDIKNRLELLHYNLKLILRDL